MDIYCPTCGEPFDNDTLHEVAEEMDSTYAKVAADFRRRGCKALEEAWGPQPHCVPGNDGRTATASALYELMGDDMDGAAALFEDAEAMGLF